MRLSRVIMGLTLGIKISLETQAYAAPASFLNTDSSFQEESLPSIPIEIFQKIENIKDPHLIHCLNALRATEAVIKERLITPVNKRKFYEFYNPAVRKINQEIKTFELIVPGERRKYKKILLFICRQEKKLLHKFIHLYSKP